MTLWCLTSFFISCSNEEIVPSVTFGSLASDTIHSDMVYPTEGGTQTLKFNSNVDWEVSVATNASGNQWCRVSTSSGVAGNNNNVNVIVDENTGTDDRSTVVTINAGSLTKKIIVTQKQKNSILLTKQKYEIGAEGGSIDVEAKTNVVCSVIIPSEFNWITQSSTTASRALVTNKYKFDIAPSEEYEKREGYIVIEGESILDTVMIYQSGSNIMLLTQNSFTVGAEGETITAEIKTNCEYEIIMPNVGWIKQYSGSRAVSSHNVSFIIDRNEEYDSRSAEIIIKDTKSERQENITITQLQKDAFFIDSDEYSVKADGGASCSKSGHKRKMLC